MMILMATTRAAWFTIPIETAALDEDYVYVGACCIASWHYLLRDFWYSGQIDHCTRIPAGFI